MTEKTPSKPQRDLPRCPLLQSSIQSHDGVHFETSEAYQARMRREARLGLETNKNNEKVNVTAWKVTIYGLAISIPFLAARVGWIESSSHKVIVFRTLRQAKSHISRVQDLAKFSLVPVRWKGIIEEVQRDEDWLDRLENWLNMNPNRKARP